MRSTIMIRHGIAAALLAAASDTGSDDGGVAAADDAAEPIPFMPKLTVATLGTVPARAKAEKKRIHLCRIFGICTGTKMKTDQAGEPIVAIVGNFEGLNIETGLSATSSTLYLPGGIQEVLEAAVDGRDNTSVGIPFAVDVYSKPDNNKAGYTYDADFIQKPSGRVDPLEALRAATAEARPLK